MNTAPKPQWFSAWTVLLALLLAGSSCGDSAVEGFQPVQIPLADIASLSRLSSGEVLAGDRITGTIYRFSLTDQGSQPDPVVVGRVPVSTDGQRGLLGMAIDDADRLFAAWTMPDNQLVVAEVPLAATSIEVGELSDPRVVWQGFESSIGANGGHLEPLPDGRLALGVGTLRRSALIDDPEAVNGKLLAIDPDASPEQAPEVLSAGWKNPFAFTVTAAGELWVADNEPEDGSSERIGRGDLADAPRLDLTNEIAPGALVELAPGRLGVCSFITGEMRSVSLNGDGLTSSQPGQEVLDDCRTAALVIDERWVLVSNQDQLRLRCYAACNGRAG